MIAAVAVHTFLQQVHGVFNISSVSDNAYDIYQQCLWQGLDTDIHVLALRLGLSLIASTWNCQCTTSLLGHEYTVALLPQLQYWCSN